MLYSNVKTTTALIDTENRENLVGKEKDNYKKHAVCAECIHADHNKMKCFPHSKECKKEYDLTEEDFYIESRCDFFCKKSS